MLYLRFIICLTVGLFGVSLVLSTLMDALLSEWDMVADVQGVLNRISKKNRVVGVESMRQDAPQHLSTRLMHENNPQPQLAPAGPVQGRAAEPVERQY